VHVSARQVANELDLAIVPAMVQSAAFAALRFFDRRFRGNIRAFGIPNRPRTLFASGRNPSNRYASDSFRLIFKKLSHF